MSKIGSGERNWTIPIEKTFEKLSKLTFMNIKFATSENYSFANYALSTLICIYMAYELA